MTWWWEVVELERAEIDAWLEQNPPPAEWTEGRYAYAALEMPVPPGKKWPASIEEPAQ